MVIRTFRRVSFLCTALVALLPLLFTWIFLSYPCKWQTEGVPTKMLGRATLKKFERVAFEAIPRVPQVFLACGGNFQCGPKADTSLAVTTNEAIDVCLWMLKESNKNRCDSFSVRNSVLSISHVTFRDCPVDIFTNNLSWNSCIRNYKKLFSNTKASCGCSFIGSILPWKKIDSFYLK